MAVISTIGIVVTLVAYLVVAVAARDPARADYAAAFPGARVVAGYQALLDDRDVEAGKQIDVPANYYPDDDPRLCPSNLWRAHAHLLYGSWINEIYQTTPFDLRDIGAR